MTYDRQSFSGIGTYPFSCLKIVGGGSARRRKTNECQRAIIDAKVSDFGSCSRARQDLQTTYHVYHSADLVKYCSTYFCFDEMVDKCCSNYGNVGQILQQAGVSVEMTQD